MANPRRPSGQIPAPDVIAIVRGEMKSAEPRARSVIPRDVFDVRPGIRDPF
jgi:hypothetical protein